MSHMLPKALKVELNRRSKEKRPKMRCFSLWAQSMRISNLCAVVGSSPGRYRLFTAPLVAVSQLPPPAGGTLHLGNSERNLRAMGLGLEILLPANGWRVPSGLSG